MSEITAHRGEILHIKRNPSEDSTGFEYLPDGLLLVREGKIENVAPAATLLDQLPETIVVTHHLNSLIIPGLIDTHVHYPQLEMIGAHGAGLLQWLESYTYPTENKFRDEYYAQKVARQFLDELLANGTTTAMVFATVHPRSVDAFFSAAWERGLRMICGKVLMDRNAPEYLLECPQQGDRESRRLIHQWHRKGRLAYAVTPRFAPTSSPRQLAMAGKLLSEYPDIYLQTHLSESPGECQWVQSLFPDSQCYLDVYDRYGLVTDRSVFAHGIHLSEDEFHHLAQKNAALSFCPSSNLFLGSGLFKLHATQNQRVRTGMGTDVGAGTSLSMLTTLCDAYKVVKLGGHDVTPMELFYHATLGGAEALALDHCLGNFTKGKEADFVVLDYSATPYLEYRMRHCRDINEKLFAAMVVGDDRMVSKVFIEGRQVYSNPNL